MLILKSDSEVLIDQNENDGEEEEAVMDYGQQRERSDKDGEVFEVFSSLSLVFVVLFQVLCRLCLLSRHFRFLPPTIDC